MEKPSQTKISYKGASLLMMLAVVTLIGGFIMPTMVIAASPVQELVSAGGNKHQAVEISLYGVVGQSSPLGAAENTAGKRLFSGNLLSADGIGAITPKDSDGDGTPDTEDDFPNNLNETIDSDEDGIGDNTDPDDDNDGTVDGEDDFPFDPNEDTDTDDDLIGDNSDPDDDNDNISDLEEDQGPNNGDGNNDGTLDSLQLNVTSLRIYDSQEYVTLISEPGTKLSQVEAAPNPSATDAPGEVVFTYGFFNFTISGFGSGTTTLTMNLPADASPNGYYKYGRTPNDAVDHWYSFLFDGTTGADISDNVITLTFMDADRGDDVLTADSLIIDLGGPTFAVPEDGGDGGGGGGACFIESLGI
jgi:hypothetical protein